jgi:CheY-like chemotaxis protein
MPSGGFEMPSSRIKLLIVDDEPMTRDLISQVFHQMGHAVRAAEDGFAALQEIRQDVPDVVLSDLNMPGMSGFELLSVVRRRFPAIRAVAMSGAFSGESVQPGVAADAFYEKASGLAHLVKIMETISDPKQEPPQKHRTLAPIWIQRDEDAPSGETYVTVSCPECLRTFPQISGKAVGNVNIHQTPCVYCRTMIHFAIVQPTTPHLPQAFQRKSVAVVAAPLQLPVAN